MSGDLFIALTKFSNRLLPKLKVEMDTRVMSIVGDTIISLMEEMEEEERRNVCQVVIKSGDRAGQVCGKAFKCGMCPTHRPHNSNVTPKEPEAGSNDSYCDMTLKSGIRAGQECGKKCAPGSERCAIHSRLDTPGSGCAYVFARGEKKDTYCDKKRCGENEAYCTFHKSAMEKSASKSSSDDEPVYENNGKNEAKKPVKEKKPKKEKESNKASEAAPVPQQIQAVRRKPYLAVKGTNVAISEDGENILGSLTKNEETGLWEMNSTFINSEMKMVRDVYGIKFSDILSNKMVLEDD